MKPARAVARCNRRGELRPAAVFHPAAPRPAGTPLTPRLHDILRMNQPDPTELHDHDPSAPGGPGDARAPALGLRPGVVRLVPHDARWAELYREEAARIRDALDGVLIDIQHFGSTSIPGIHAKPILDMIAGVPRLGDEMERLPRLRDLGYEYAHWAGVPGHHVFGKGRERTHLLHVVEHGGVSWRENLWFRDQLRAHPALAAEYDALTLRLARAHPDDRARYTAEKSAFVQRIRGQAH